MPPGCSMSSAEGPGSDTSPDLYSIKLYTLCNFSQYTGRWVFFIVDLFVVLKGGGGRIQAINSSN